MKLYKITYRSVDTYCYVVAESPGEAANIFNKTYGDRVGRLDFVSDNIILQD